MVFMYNNCMVFEFDPKKSEANKAKHGIDFVEAQEIWHTAVVEIDAAVSGESRTLVVGKIAGKYWTAVVTKRGEATRIISVRRSRDKEEMVYEQQE